MLHSADDIKDIKAKIAMAKKSPVNIAICLGKSPENTIIKMDRKRSPAILAKQAKAEGETIKLIAGRLAIEGRNATLTVIEEPAGSVARLIKAAFKDIAELTLDFTFVVDLNAEEESAEGQGAEDESAASSPDAPEATAEDLPASAPTKAEWDTAWAGVAPKFAALLAKAGTDAAKLTAVRDFAFGKAAAGQFDAAIKALKSLVQLMATVAKALADTNPAGDAPSDAAPPDAAPQVDAKTLVLQLAQIKPQIAALQGPVAVKLNEMFQSAVAQVKSGALAEAASGLAKITTALGKIAASTEQAAARAASGMATQTPTSVEPPQTPADPRTEKLEAAAAQLRKKVDDLAGGDAKSALLTLLDQIADALAEDNADAVAADLKRVEDGLTLQAEVDRLAPLVASAASQGKVADVNALTNLFNLVAETIPAANHAKAMDNLAKVEAMLAAGAAQGKTAIEAEIPDDVRPFATSRLEWAATRKTLRAELGKLEKAITDTFAGIEGLEDAAGDLGPLFSHLEKLDDRLEDKLDQIVSSKPGPERSKLQVEASSLLNAYQAELASPFFADVDQNNGFVSVAVTSTARRVMADLSKLLAA